MLTTFRIWSTGAFVTEASWSAKPVIDPIIEIAIPTIPIIMIKFERRLPSAYFQALRSENQEYEFLNASLKIPIF